MDRSWDRGPTRGPGLFGIPCLVNRSEFANAGDGLTFPEGMGWEAPAPGLLRCLRAIFSFPFLMPELVLVPLLVTLQYLLGGTGLCFRESATPLASQSASTSEACRARPGRVRTRPLS